MADDMLAPEVVEAVANDRDALLRRAAEVLALRPDVDAAWGYSAAVLLDDITAALAAAQPAQGREVERRSKALDELALLDRDLLP